MTTNSALNTIQDPASSITVKLISAQDQPDNHYAKSAFPEYLSRNSQSLNNESVISTKGRTLSILKNGRGKSLAQDSVIDDRCDNYGVPIKQGGKKHRIKFKPELKTISEVENWKKYNVVNDEVCNCNIM